MFMRIVVPLDGTPFAEAALAPACELARTFGSHLIIVRAVGPVGLPRTAPPQDTERAFEHLEEADAYLHGVVGELRRAGFKADLVVYVAAPGTAIAQAAEVDRADLIVMTVHPRWRASFPDNTSTALRVLACCQVPILAWRWEPGGEAATVRDIIQARGSSAGPEAPILVPLDGSRFAEAALPVAEGLARQFGSHLVLVRAVENETALVATFHAAGTSAPEEITAEQEARAYLQRVQAEVERHGLGVTAAVHVGSPAGAIDSTWRESHASLIVMASHGKSAVATRFFGSVAARTIEDVNAPVLVVRPELPGRLI